MAALRSIIYGNRETSAGQKRTSSRRRNAARYAGPAHFADVDFGPGARSHNCPHHRAPLGRSSAGRARLALPGTAPPGLALARPASRFSTASGRLGAIVAMVEGLIAAVNGGLNLAMAT